MLYFCHIKAIFDNSCHVSMQNHNKKVNERFIGRCNAVEIRFIFHLPFLLFSNEKHSLIE